MTETREEYALRQARAALASVRQAEEALHQVAVHLHVAIANIPDDDEVEEVAS
jgi:hypothetical protein